MFYGILSSVGIFDHTAIIRSCVDRIRIQPVWQESMSLPVSMKDQSLSHTMTECDRHAGLNRTVGNTLHVPICAGQVPALRVEELWFGVVERR